MRQSKEFQIVCIVVGFLSLAVGIFAFVLAIIFNGTAEVYVFVGLVIVAGVWSFIFGIVRLAIIKEKEASDYTTQGSGWRITKH